MNGYVFDIEANNLYLQSTKIWIIHMKSLDGSKELTIFPFKESKEESRDKFMEWHHSFGEEPLVVSYNGIGYDHWMLWKHLGVSFHIGKNSKDWIDGSPCTILDLFVLSQFVEPDRQRHSLKSYGKELEDEKLEFSDFSQYSPEMLTYCIQDVDLTLNVYKELTQKLVKMYKGFYRDKYNKQQTQPFKAIQKDYWLYAAQAFTGIEFNKEAAIKLVKEIEDEMLEIEKEVLPQLPPRKLKEGEKKYYSMPAKPFKLDGSPSATMLKWIEEHKAELLPDNKILVHGNVYQIKSKELLDIKLPMEIKDGNDIKEWFMRGWIDEQYKDMYENLEWVED
jgi:RNase_H superfamily